MLWIKVVLNNPANVCCKWQFAWIPFLTSFPVSGFPPFWGSLIPYKTRPAPVPLTPRFPHREEKRCEIHHHHQAHQEMADILQKEKKTKPPHHQIRVCHIHAYSQSSTLTPSAPPGRTGTQQILNPELPTARDKEGEREETAPAVICCSFLQWYLGGCSGCPGKAESLGQLGQVHPPSGRILHTPCAPCLKDSLRWCGSATHPKNTSDLPRGRLLVKAQLVPHCKFLSSSKLSLREVF